MEDRLNDNGVRVRRDGAGSPFGELHRNYWDPAVKLTDIDYTFVAKQKYELIDTHDEIFAEYVKNNGSVRVVTIIESVVNDGRSDRWLKKLNLHDSEPGIQACLDISKRLNIPLVVIVHELESGRFIAHRIFHSGKREECVLVKDRTEIMRQWHKLTDKRTAKLFEE